MPILNQIAGNIKEFFQPAPDLRARDVARELPEGLKEVAGSIGNFFVSTGQASWRGFGAAASAITDQEFTPREEWEKQLYGTDKPISFKSVGAELGISEQSKFAAPIGVALVAADLIPGGKVTKTTAVNLLKNANKADDALKILKQMMGIADDVARKFAPRAAELTDVKQLSSLVDDVVKESQDVIRLAQKGKQVVSGLFKEAKPLIQEATKFKTAEDFVDAKLPITKRTVTADDKGIPRIYSKQLGGDWTEQITGAKISDKGMIAWLDVKAKEQFEPASKLVKDLFREEGAWIKDGGHLSLPKKQVLNKMKDEGLVEKVTIPNPYTKGAEDYTVWRLKSQLTDIWKKAQGGADDLMTQARKYKSAEEFVGAQQPIYKGLKGDTSLGSFSTDVSHAQGWADRTGGQVVERYFKPDTKFAPFEEYHTKFAELKTEKATDAYFKTKGYDGVDFRNSPTMKGATEKEIRIWNPDKLQTKSQLTSIWEKAQGGADDLMTQAKKYKSAEEFVKAQGIGEIPSKDSRLLYHVSENPNITELKPQTNGSRGVFVTPGEPSRSNGYVYVIDRTKLPDGVLKQDPSQARDFYIDKLIPSEAIVAKSKISQGKIETPIKSQLTDIWNKAQKAPELNQSWYHGTDQFNKGTGDTFYSQSKDVAGDYGKVSKSIPPAKNPLIVSDKQEIADMLGYKKDPFTTTEIDKLAKEYAQSKGHDSILYRSGSLDAPELHVFGDTKSQLTDIWKEAKQLTPAGKELKEITRERGFITSVKEAFPNASSKVAGQYISRSTDKLAMKAKNLIRDDYKTAEKIALTGTDENAVATASELIKRYADEAANATDTIIEASMNDKMAEVANTIARALTESGRTSQAASILGLLTPEGQVRFAAREIQKYNEMVKNSKFTLLKEVPELTGEQAGKIVERMKKIQIMPNGIQKAQEFQKLQEGIQELVPSPLMKKITSVWKAGLLTGLKTSGVNIFSNVTHFTTETAKDIPAVIVDTTTSLFTGKRTKTFTMRGVTGGTLEGFDKGWQYLKTGFDERNIAAKLDYKKVNFGNSPISKGIQKYEETIFRIIGAEDQPFYYGAKAKSLFDQALAQGKNLGLKGQELISFANDLVKNPTDEMLKYAAIDAETAVFQNKTTLGLAAKKIQDIPSVGEFIIPFTRTPSAIAMQIINYSPIGIVKTIIENIGKGKFDQRSFSQGIGRGLTGTGIMYLGSKLLEKGLVTLDYPDNEREQKLWELEGRKPNSIKIDDKWRTIQSLGPSGSLLLIGAHFQQGLQNTGSATGAMAQGAFGGLKSFSEQPFLQGLSNLGSAINDPERFGDVYFGNLVGSSIPTLVNDIARAKDVSERRPRSILERVQARIPYLREALEPQVDVFGRERQRGGNILETMVDPTRPSKDISTPTVNELRRLFDAGYKVSPTLLGDKNGYPVLTPEQNTDLWKRAGEITESKLTAFINDPRYERLADDEKAKIIETFVEKSKIIARAEKIIELTDGLYSNDLREKLSEFKQGKLITRDVFNKYKELK